MQMRLKKTLPAVPAMLQKLRETLSAEGVPESRSADEEGYYFVVESRRDVSVHYHNPRGGAATDVSASRPIHIGLLKCCDEMAMRGYTTTLILSPRTFALHISP